MSSTAQGIDDATVALEEIHSKDLVHGCISGDKVIFEGDGKGRARLILPLVIKEGHDRPAGTASPQYPFYNPNFLHCTKDMDIIALFIVAVCFLYGLLENGTANYNQILEKARA